MAGVIPIIRESFSDKYIEQDFSKNIVLKPKHEVQDGHFLENRTPFIVQLLNLSDDINHGTVSVNEVLEEIL